MLRVTHSQIDSRIVQTFFSPLTIDSLRDCIEDADEMTFHSSFRYSFLKENGMSATFITPFTA